MALFLYNRRVSGRKILCLLAGVLALALTYKRHHAPVLGNDSFQYLSAAAHVAAGDCICGDLVHFEEQLAGPGIPTPFTHFAPGYPILLALFSRAGLQPEAAGYLISSIAFLVTIWLMWDLGVASGLKPANLLPVILLWIVHMDALFYAASVGPETAFTAVLLGIATLLARDVADEGARPLRLVALGVLAGLGYALRYAGLFALPVVALYLAWRGWHSREARRFAAAGMTAMAAITAAIMLRNIAASGSWKGGFSAGGGHPLRYVLSEIARSGTHIVLGWMELKVGVIHVLLAVFLLAAVFLRKGSIPGSSATWKIFLWLGMLVGAYTAGLMAAMLTSIAADMPRYLLQIYPILLVAGAVAIAPEARPWQTAALTGAALALASLHVQNLAAPFGEPARLVTASNLNQEYERVSISRWITSQLKASESVTATDGQAVQYYLQKPVVSLIESEFASEKLTEQRLHTTMRKFHSRYLILFPEGGAFAGPVQQGTPVLRDILSGTVPNWLHAAAGTRSVAVFECADCAGS